MISQSSRNVMMLSASGTRPRDSRNTLSMAPSPRSVDPPSYMREYAPP